MSKLSEEYLKILTDIEKHISNEEEKKYVLKKVADLSALYMDIVDRITGMSERRMNQIEKHQDELEKKFSKVNESVGLIKKDIYEDSDYDFEIVCPYCNHEFVADVEDELKEEIECPKCHNIIELDWDDEEDGCDGCCSSCGHHGNECGEFDEEYDGEFEDEDEISDDNDENSIDGENDEDDDM